MENYILVSLPFPADLTLNRVSKKAGNTKGAFAHLRSLTTAITVVDGEEVKTTKASGNSGHNVNLNAAQYAEAERVLAPLREFAKAGAKATKAQTAAANAIVAEIVANGGIRLPRNQRGRQPGEGESIGNFFAGIVAATPSEEETPEETTA